MFRGPEGRPRFQHDGVVLITGRHQDRLTDTGQFGIGEDADMETAERQLRVIHDARAGQFGAAGSGARQLQQCLRAIEQPARGGRHDGDAAVARVEQVTLRPGMLPVEPGAG